MRLSTTPEAHHLAARRLYYLSRTQHRRFGSKRQRSLQTFRQMYVNAYLVEREEVKFLVCLEASDGKISRSMKRERERERDR